MTEAMPFLQKYDIPFLRPPTIARGCFAVLVYLALCPKGREPKPLP